MKKIIRVKIKHILGGTGIFISLLLLGYIFLPYIMFSIGERYNQNGEPLAAKLYYDRLDRFFPHHSQTAEALEKAAEITAHHNLLMISSAGVGGVSGMGSAPSHGTQSYYKKLVERFPNTWQGKRAQTELVKQDINNALAQDQIDKAFHFMKNYYETVNAPAASTYFDASVALTAAAALRSKGLYDEGLRFLSYMVELQGYSADTRVYEGMAEFHKLLGNSAEAEQYYMQVLSQYEKWIEEEKQFFPQDDPAEPGSYYAEKKEALLMKIASLQDRPIIPGSITGIISLKGAPLNSIQIFLQPQNDPHGGAIIGSTTEDALWTASDRNGDFAFNHVPPGRYSLGFILNLDEVGDVVLKGGFFPQSTLFIGEGESYHWNFQLVDTLKVLSPIENHQVTGDTIHFQWEAFEEAAYYTLELGTYFQDGSGSRSFIYSSRQFDTNDAMISLEELTYTSTGMAFDDKGPTPDSLLGFAHPRGKYFWGVRAHDKAGNILTASIGYLKSQNADFQVANRSLRKGDELLLERKIQKAIAAYEEDVSNNPRDIYALAMLAKLYGISYDSTMYPYTDLKKALSYYERLHQMTGNSTFVDHMIRILYDEQQDYERALTLLERLEEEKVLDSWHQRQRVMISIHHGDYEEALEKLLSLPHHDYQVETALRIITNNFESFKITEKNAEEERWLEGIRAYQDTYASLDTGLKESIRARRPLDALQLLESKELTPHQAFLKISLQIMEPSIKIQEYEELKGFVSAYGSTDPLLSQLIQRLFMTSIH